MVCLSVRPFVLWFRSKKKQQLEKTLTIRYHILDLAKLDAREKEKVLELDNRFKTVCFVSKQKRDHTRDTKVLFDLTLMLSRDVMVAKQTKLPTCPSCDSDIESTCSSRSSLFKVQTETGAASRSPCILWGHETESKLASAEYDAYHP